MQTLPFFEEFNQTIPITQIPAMQNLIKEIYHFINTSNIKEKPLIAIIGDSDKPNRTHNIKSTTKALKEKLKDKCLDVLWAKPDDLTFKRNNLYTKEHKKPITVMYRFHTLKEMHKKKDHFKAVLLAMKNPDILQIGIPQGNILSNKGVIALLSESSLPNSSNKLLNLDVNAKKIIQKHIPWSRILTENNSTDKNGNKIDLINYCIENKHNLILKPTDSYGGIDITLGWKASDTTWEKIIKESLDSDAQFIVLNKTPLQEINNLPTINKIEGDNKSVYFLDGNPLLCRGEISGCHCRLSPDAITNVTQGATLVPVFKVK